MAKSDDDILSEFALSVSAEIIGNSAALKRVMESAKIVARSNLPVLLRGETGTGKESLAKLIHAHSLRCDGPFVKLNCAALSPGLLESELFGHEKGAFTGALSKKVGRFEMAHGGTLLLDEIGEMTPEFQAKSLRVLQEGEFERVGGTKTLKVDVRLIFATNKNLELAVTAGEFREDLYYRINVLPLTLPPLRERDGDISLLATEFLQRFSRQNGRPLKFASSTLDILSRCEFPGNIRELQNCVQRTATLAHSNTIMPADLACQQGVCYSQILKSAVTVQNNKGMIYDFVRDEAVPTGEMTDASTFTPGAATKWSTLIDRESLQQAMTMAGWVQAKAARNLGLTPRQVGYALRKHGIKIRSF
ncbi:transcriptional regulator, Fis family (plasmid) [Rhizobium leguminosarum bv. trifolii WSM2304]|uniref:Nif-specific regulatory protein n=1 Tax=Rhizobium leguminosarum bv. trifolii (strain WSM2304) TaxID=395492 RepID=A0ABF7QVQ3_RHILW|nr:nif-specific transcriptional activator NifA [Rhizobium leguminosarum]ACI58265.1 transcriptional regulator, Fis family [Rhizobium leguminosarum bv. trifolii WSM2304]